MTAILQAPPTLQAAHRLFSADEYEQMIEAGILKEDERVELIKGEIRPMSPIGDRHAACVKRLNAFLSRQIGSKLIVGVQDPVRLSDDSEPQPDISVLRYRDDFYAGAQPRSRDVLLVVEVSDSSLGFDREVKLPSYAAAGIAEAWLVDLNHAVVERHTRPMNGRYAEVITLQHGETLQSPMLDLVVAVDDILG